jgi:hypothetical protein
LVRRALHQTVGGLIRPDSYPVAPTLFLRSDYASFCPPRGTKGSKLAPSSRESASRANLPSDFKNLAFSPGLRTLPRRGAAPLGRTDTTVGWAVSQLFLKPSSSDCAKSRASPIDLPRCVHTATILQIVPRVIICAPISGGGRVAQSCLFPPCAARQLYLNVLKKA